MKPVLAYAFAKADDSYESAEILFSHQHYAGSVNRCYYAMYYIVSTLVDERKNKHVKTHSGLIRVFSDEFIKNGELAQNLITIFKKIFEKRQLADYDFNFNISEEETKEILEETRIFLETIRQILSEQ
ncbi:MAG: HEPN domain-containing protein [Bacteroidia bacterium]